MVGSSILILKKYELIKIKKNANTEAYLVYQASIMLKAI